MKSGKLLSMFLGLQLLASPTMSYADSGDTPSNSTINYNDLSGDELRNLVFGYATPLEEDSSSYVQNDDFLDYIVSSIHDVYDMYRLLGNKSDYFYYFIYHLQDAISRYPDGMDMLHLVPPTRGNPDSYYTVIDTIDSYLNQYDLFFDLTNIDDGYGNQRLSVIFGNLDYEKTEFVYSMNDAFNATTRFVSSLDEESYSYLYAEPDLIGWANLRRNIVYVNLDHRYNDYLQNEADYQNHIEYHEIEHLAQYRNGVTGNLFEIEAQAIYASIYLSQDLPSQLEKMYIEFYGYDMVDPYKTVYDVFIQELRNRYGVVGDERGVGEFNEDEVRNVALELYNEVF